MPDGLRFDKPKPELFRHTFAVEVKKGKEKFFSLANTGFLVILTGVISFLLYSNTIPNFYNLDDELITENHILTDNSFSTFKKIFTEPYYKDRAGNKYEYRPMVLVSYFFEFLVFGRNPHVSHFFNVTLFSATCMILLYLLLSLFENFNPVDAPEKSYSRKLQNSGDGWLMGMAPPVVISLAIALLFAVHPIHTEVVASIKNRDEILSLLFAITSWYFALRFIGTKKLPFYLLFLLFFVIGLFSKQTSITFSILIPVSILLFRQVSLKIFLLLILPIVLISIIFSPIYLLYKKAALFIAQILLLISLYYLLAKRDALAEWLSNLYGGLSGFIKKISAAVAGYVQGFTAPAARKKTVAATGVVLIIISGGIFGAKHLMTEKAAEIAKVKWNVQDRIHDFNELQLVPAMQTPAPAIVPIAGRRLNYVEIPLLYEENVSIKSATSIYVLGNYLKLMFIPYPLRFYYGYGQIPLVGFGNAAAIVSLVIYAVIVVLMLYLLIVRRHLIAAFGLLFFIVAIIPLSNMLTPIAGIMAERLAYPSSLGYCIAFAYWILFPHFYPSKRIFGVQLGGIARGFLILFAAILLAYTAMTVSRNFLWKDHITLMRHDIEYMQGSVRGHHLYASHLAVKASEKKQYQLPENVKVLKEALMHFRKAMEIYPNFPNVWYDMAKVHMLLGDNKSAMEAYASSVRKDTLNASPSFELGVVLEKENRLSEAESAYKLAIQRDSLFKEAYINLSYLYYRQARYQESIAVNLTALKHLPKAYEIYVNLGRTYLMVQNTPVALTYLEKAMAINHSDKSIAKMMAELYAQMGNAERAEYYRRLR